ncbi:MAG: hypothetical protein ACK42Z_01780 [Candidatus Kapaibacteriota bacterium]
MGTQKYLDYAREVIDMLRRSTQRLIYSYNKVNEFFTPKNEFTEEELEVIESMCSRFARTNDLLLQKAFRFIDIYELKGYDLSVPQRIANAYKRNIIEDEKEFKYIRELRNEVAHNYATDYLYELFTEIINYTPTLLDIVERTINYIETRILAKN